MKVDLMSKKTIFIKIPRCIFLSKYIHSFIFIKDAPVLLPKRYAEEINVKINVWTWRQNVYALHAI